MKPSNASWKRPYSSIRSASWRRWLEYVSGIETETELEALRRSANRERPFGTETWEKAVAGRLGLQHTMRPRGRPKKAKD